jgi:hypothetical protein
MWKSASEIISKNYICLQGNEYMWMEKKFEKKHELGMGMAVNPMHFHVSTHMHTCTRTHIHSILALESILCAF